MNSMDENLDDVIASLIDFTEESSTEPLLQPVILLTENAAHEIRRIIKAENLDKALRLRVAVEGGGCSGLSYKLGFDKKTDEDMVCESQGLEIVIDPRHALYLDKCEIDYPQGLDARGFVFRNPNASESCGCGTSFAV